MKSEIGSLKDAQDIEKLLDIEKKIESDVH